MKGPRIPNLALLVIIALATLLAGERGPAKTVLAPHANQEGESAKGATTLDFETYRTRVEPIFLKKREGGVRCYDCHSVLTTRLRLQAFLPGDSSWTEEQSRQNFASVSELASPNNP